MLSRACLRYGGGGFDLGSHDGPDSDDDDDDVPGLDA